MKVTKIDINREILDVKLKPILRMPDYDKPQVRKRLEDGKNIEPGTMEFKVVDYELRYLQDSIDKTKKYYYVRMDDRKLFDEILQINRDCLREKIQKEIQSETEGLNITITKMINSINSLGGIIRGEIKDLPFWKRLFNIF